MTRTPRFFLFFLCITCSLSWNQPVSAQPAQVIFENYTIENGLQNNIVQQAFQDRRGYMWFATNHGVCRYDGYKFHSFRNDPKDSKSLAGLLARVIYEDKSGNLWIGTESGGLNRFDRKQETFAHILPSNSIKGVGTSVKAIVEDKSGSLWLGTNIGLKVYNPKSGSLKSYPYLKGNPNSPSDTYVRVLQFDASGKLWVGTNAGLDLFDPSSGKFFRVYSRNPELSDEIWEIYRDPQGTLWVGTYNNGLFRINPATIQIEKIPLPATRQWSKTVRSVVRDQQDLYWIGSRAGLFVYNAKSKTSSFFENIENEPKSLVNSSVLNICKDSGNNLWVCTRGGISLMVPSRQIFEHYRAFNNNYQHLNNNEVYAIWADQTSQKLWIGTGAGGVNILDRNTGKFTYMVHDGQRSNTISSNSIKAINDDNRGNIWIGTYDAGISVFSPSAKRFTYFKTNPQRPESLSDNSVWSIFKDSKGRMWVGTDAGLDLFEEKTNSFIHHTINNKKQQVSWIREDSKGRLWLGLLSVTAIFDPGKGVVHTIREQGSCFFEDSKRRFWLSTRNNGLILMNDQGRQLKYFDERNGLPNNQAFQILEDNKACLWISTANGLTRFDPERQVFKNFDKRDGLQNNQFHYGAAFKLSSGELVFGGINGFNVFNPAAVRQNQQKPSVVLTGLKVFDKAVAINDKFSILKEAVSESRELRIPYKYNILTFDFAALNFVRPEKNKYKVQLVGFDKDWNEAGTRTSVTYTNLDPGEYKLRVIASNNDNVWNTEGLTVGVEILPPFWKTWWFNLLMVLTVLGVIYLIVIFIMNREKIKQQLDLERIKVKQLNEVNDIKLSFFTNISHEIRTPLTLIIGPLEQFKSSELPKDQKTQVDIMYRNASSLLKLVNQLLDFRKLETGNLSLDLKKGDLVFFMQEVINSFSQLAKDKGINLRLNTFSESLTACYDQDKLEKVLNNLISNAIKFTERNGSVSVYLTVNVNDSLDESNEFIEIVVKDTGIGIEKDNLSQIFRQFFQSENSRSRGGTGLGLALSKELVELQGGEIFVDSEPGKGTRFTVRIPLIKKEDGDVDCSEPEPLQLVDAEPSQKDLLTENIMLVVEDNADVRKFIRIHFQSQFHIEEAADGLEGIALAQKLLPDIILSDVMMPGVDGIELCKKLKNEEFTSHIPIILLTALSSKENTIAGLSSGADDYITKPFDISILQSKIENLLSLRNAIRKQFEGRISFSPSNPEMASPDEKFIQKAVEVIEKNIDDDDLDIEAFSKEMAVSRMQLYRKLSVLTGMTVKEFIRDIRLKRAIQLLDQRSLNVSEVAYAVGFKDLSHFRKCFREKFGMNATEYLKKKEYETR